MHVVWLLLGGNVCDRTPESNTRNAPKPGKAVKKALSKKFGNNAEVVDICASRGSCEISLAHKLQVIDLIQKSESQKFAILMGAHNLPELARAFDSLDIDCERTVVFICTPRRFSNNKKNGKKTLRRAQQVLQSHESGIFGVCGKQEFNPLKKRFRKRKKCFA